MVGDCSLPLPRCLVGGIILIRPVHPFPARMAPGLALDSLMQLGPESIVLDPMSGSGTVLRQAAELGHTAIGFDVDPLAVLMARVWTTPVNDAEIEKAYKKLLVLAGSRDCRRDFEHPDRETEDFIRYWFGDTQIAEISAIASAISIMESSDNFDVSSLAIDVLKLNLSRIIVTKEQCASLARDTSHSRPHRVALTSTYNVFDGYEKSLRNMRQRLIAAPPPGRTRILEGDARELSEVLSNSVDAVVTSPPYLNAIDYLRGHRMSLVWLGWTLKELRRIRAESIGAERAPSSRSGKDIELIVTAMIGASELPSRHLKMVTRYALDLHGLLEQVRRVLKAGGRATMVVGNSCLKGTFIQNAAGVAQAAWLFGLKEIGRSERDLPTSSRYLPITGEALGKRMRTETVLSFEAL